MRNDQSDTSKLLITERGMPAASSAKVRVDFLSESEARRFKHGDLVSKKQIAFFVILAIIVYVALIGELPYLYFSAYNNASGLANFLEIMAGFNFPALRRQIDGKPDPTAAWYLPRSITYPAIALGVLDFITGLFLMEPSNEAMSVLGIMRREKYKNFIMLSDPDESAKKEVRLLSRILLIYTKNIDENALEQKSQYQIGFCNQEYKYEQRNIEDADFIDALEKNSEINLAITALDSDSLQKEIEYSNKLNVFIDKFVEVHNGIIQKTGFSDRAAQYAIEYDDSQGTYSAKLPLSFTFIRRATDGKIKILMTIVMAALTVLTFIAAQLHFGLGATADGVAVNSLLSLKQLHVDPQTRDEVNWPVTGFFITAGLAYYDFLSLRDVFLGLAELAKGRGSIFYLLWERDPAAFYIVLSRVAVASGQRGAMFGLITQQYTSQVLKWNPSDVMWATLVGVVITIFITAVSRSRAPFMEYLKPYASKLINDVPVSYLTVLGANFIKPRVVWNELQWIEKKSLPFCGMKLPTPGQKITVFLSPLIFGLIRAIPAFEILQAFNTQLAMPTIVSLIASRIIRSCLNKRSSSMGVIDIERVQETDECNEELDEQIKQLPKKSCAKKLVGHVLTTVLPLGIAVPLTYGVYCLDNVNSDIASVLRTGSALFIAALILLHALYADSKHALCAIGFEKRKELAKQGNCVDLVIEDDLPRNEAARKTAATIVLIATFFNVGSQTSRILTGFNSWDVVQRFTGLPPRPAMMLTILIVFEVAWTTFFYFLDKLLKPIENWGKRIGFFSDQ